MREIKFRAWDTLKKSMHEVAAIDFVVPYASLWKRKGNVRSTYEVEVDTINLMQYTCLKDRNGKEIYEGDIVNDWTGRLLICQWGGSGSFEWQDYDAWEAGYYDAYLKTEDITALNKETTLVVIGNIYENPELLEAKK